jgi:hypothetical protein
VLKSMGENVTDDEVDEMILMADVDGARAAQRTTHARAAGAVLTRDPPSARACVARPGDGQVSFEEFSKLVMSLSAPQPQQAPHLGGAPPYAPPGAYAGATGLGGVDARGMGAGMGAGMPPHYVGAQGGFAGGASAAYDQGVGGFSGGLPPPAGAMAASGNPVQARASKAARASPRC